MASNALAYPVRLTGELAPELSLGRSLLQGREAMTGQPVGLDHQPRDLTVDDPNLACLELGSFGCGELVGVDEEDDVV